MRKFLPEDSGDARLGLIAAIVVAIAVSALASSGFDDVDIAPLAQIASVIDARHAAMNPPLSWEVGYSDVFFGSSLFFRLQEFLLAAGVSIRGHLLLQLAGHLAAVVVFWRSSKRFLPADVRAASTIMLAAAPEPALMVGENSIALFILAPLFYVAWQHARQAPGIAGHAIAGLIYALCIHLHIVALFILPVLVVDLVVSPRRNPAGAIAFTLAWVALGLVPAAQGGVGDARELAAYAAERLSAAAGPGLGGRFDLVLFAHLFAAIGIGIAIRNREVRSVPAIRDAVAWYVLAAIPAIVHSNIGAEPREMAMAAAPRAVLFGIVIAALARAPARRRRAGAFVAAVAAGVMVIELGALSVLRDRRLPPDPDFNESVSALRYSRRVRAIVRAGHDLLATPPGAPPVFAGLSSGALNAVRRWDAGRTGAPDALPNIFVAAVDPPEGVSGGLRAGPVTLWPIDKAHPHVSIMHDHRAANVANDGPPVLVALEAGARGDELRIDGKAAVVMAGCAPCPDNENNTQALALIPPGGRVRVTVADGGALRSIWVLSGVMPAENEAAVEGMAGHVW
ncbi:hypothetical protein K8I61_06535 [bacterium]|nr:hypothetical protein [bacterium]